jgi:hypothetical protein
MRKINKGLAALAVTAGLMALTACGSQTLSEAQPIEPQVVETTQPPVEPEPQPAVEGEIGDESVTTGDEEPDGDNSSNDKVAVAGKESVTYDDGLVISIGNIRKSKVPEYNDHPGEPMVRFDVRIKNGTTYRMDATGASVTLSYGADGRTAPSIWVDGDDYGFTGTLAKGRSKTVGYSFEVPTKHQKDMIIEVTPDYERSAALFEASVK